MNNAIDANGNGMELVSMHFPLLPYALKDASIVSKKVKQKTFVN